MLTIANLFGKSPFAPLQTHMDKVGRCIAALEPLFEALISQDIEALEKISKQVSELQHQADLTKTDIRTHLPKSLFLPVDRGTLLEILSLQKALADQAEEIALHATMRKLPFSDIKDKFFIFFKKNTQAFWLVRKVMQELDELLEASFGGIEAQKVKGIIEQITFSRCEAILIRNQLIKHLYLNGDEMPHPVFHLALRLIEEIGRLACLSEKLGNRVRVLLELK